MKLIHLKLKFMGVLGVITKIDLEHIMALVGSLNLKKNVFITLGIMVDLKY